MSLTTAEILQALTVEVIRRLWDRGLYRSNPWLLRVHANWLPVWARWRTRITMRSVDQQAAEIVAAWELEQPSLKPPVFSEELEGETPLGGEMRLTREDVRADLDLETPPLGPISAAIARAERDQRPPRRSP